MLDLCRFSAASWTFRPFLVQQEPKPAPPSTLKADSFTDDMYALLVCRYYALSFLLSQTSPGRPPPPLLESGFGSVSSGGLLWVDFLALFVFYLHCRLMFDQFRVQFLI